MKMRRITSSGQVSVPAAVRNRWKTSSVVVEDRGDHVVIRPLPEDPIVAARGALKGRLEDAATLRETARKDEAAAEDRRR